MYYVRNGLTGIVVMQTRFLWRAKRRIRNANLTFKGQTVWLGSFLEILTDKER